jgi:hypothetical protein
MNEEQDGHLQAPGEASRDKHINFLALEQDDTEPADEGNTNTSQGNEPAVDNAFSSTDENTIDAKRNQADEQSENDLATNAGTTTDTLDAVFHNALRVETGNNLSGSNRADFYEAGLTGKSDAEEELDEMNKDDKRIPDENN